jgi:hypothetical protein
MVTMKSKPTDLAGAVEEDPGVVEAQRRSRETETALATLQEEARNLVKALDPNTHGSDDHRVMLVGAALIQARRRLQDVRAALGPAEAAMLEAREQVTRAREEAYEARRPQVYALVSAARERFYLALRQLAAEEHAVLVRICEAGNRALGRAEFTGLAWVELDNIDGLREWRGGEL